MRKSPGRRGLVEVPRPSITQDQIAEIIHRRSKARKELAWLRAEGRRILRALQAGADIEPGLLPVELDECDEGADVRIRLLVDGQAVDQV